MYRINFLHVVEVRSLNNPSFLYTEASPFYTPFNNEISKFCHLITRIPRRRIKGLYATLATPNKGRMEMATERRNGNLRLQWNSIAMEFIIVYQLQWQISLSGYKRECYLSLENRHFDCDGKGGFNEVWGENFLVSTILFMVNINKIRKRKRKNFILI